MSTLIQIKRSNSIASPNTLANGELFYSFASNTLFIGNSSNAVFNIGGFSYTSIIDNRSTQNTANSLVIRSANGIAQFNQLEILSSPVANNHAATKEYVDYFVQVYSSNAYNQANIATLIANSAYFQANAAYIQANNAYDQANAAYAQANNSYDQANGAYIQANNAANTVMVSGNAATFNAVSLNYTNTPTINVSLESGTAGNANLSFSVNTSGSGILTAQATAENAYAQANAARDQANSAYDQANAAFQAASNNQVTVAANNGLAIDNNDIMSTIYNTTISDGVTSVAVGGASALDASEWRTKNIVQVLDTILFPDIAPTYTIPTITFTSSITGTREIGETITPLLTANAVKNDANTYTQIVFRRGGATTVNTNTAMSVANIANVADQFGYSNPNNPNQRFLATYTDTFVVVSGATTWLARSSYNAGVAKKNNKGVTDARTPAIRSVNAPQAACTTFDSATTTVTGIYPYFWGVSATQPTASSIAADIAAGTTNKVLADSTGTVTVTFNASSQYVWLAHIGTSTSKTKWYNTALNNGSIGAGQFILAPVNQNVNSPDGFWTAQSFKIYISGFATTTSGSIEFRNV